MASLGAREPREKRPAISAFPLLDDPRAGTRGGLHRRAVGPLGDDDDLGPRVERLQDLLELGQQESKVLPFVERWNDDGKVDLAHPERQE